MPVQYTLMPVILSTFKGIEVIVDSLVPNLHRAILFLYELGRGCHCSLKVMAT